MRRAICACLFIACLSVAQASAQSPQPTPAPAAAAPAAPEQPKDPLGRETPRGTVLGFMNAARQQKQDVAPLYLDSGLSGEDAIELAQKLYVVLNSRLPVRVNVLSERNEGSLVNPLKPDEDIVGTINTARGPLQLIVERVEGANGTRIWLFSRETLSAIPDVYNEIDLITVDGILPPFLAQPRIGDIRIVDWILLIGGIPLLYKLLGLLGPLFNPLLVMGRKAMGRPAGPRLTVHGSVRLLILAATIRWFVLTIDLPLIERQLYAVIRVAFLICGLVWLLLLLNDFAERYARTRIHVSNLGESIALLRLARRVADVLVICAGGIAALAYFGIDATAALAGLGIGGIAVALAAQKTLENVIGGFSLVFDKAVRVGDFLKLGETLGTVDRVGLRSTRIRTLDRTILSVPNGQIATANIETFSDRDKFWFRHVIGVRYGTTPMQMRQIVTRVRELLAGQTGVEIDSVRARFFRVGASSLDIEIVAYIFALDWSAFLEVQEGLLLRIMEIVEDAGTEIAFPSQTVHLSDDRKPAGASNAAGTEVTRFTTREKIETV